MSAGKAQRDPANGKLKRVPSNGKTRRNTASITACCCTPTLVSCYLALYCDGGGSAGFYEATSGVSAGATAYKLAGTPGSACYYFDPNIVSATPAGNSYDSFAGCAECFANTGGEDCPTCDAAYHNSLSPGLGIVAGQLNACSCTSGTVTAFKTTNCGYSGNVPYNCGGPFGSATITWVYNATTCKYTVTIGGTGAVSGTAVYEKEGLTGPEGIYTRVSTVGCTWPAQFTVT